MEAMMKMVLKAMEMMAEKTGMLEVNAGVYYIFL